MMQNYQRVTHDLVTGCGRSGYVALYHYDATETVILTVQHQKEVGYS